jgi:hypothetical protein
MKQQGLCSIAQAAMCRIAAAARAAHMCSWQMICIWRCFTASKVICSWAQCTAHEAVQYNSGCCVGVLCVLPQMALSLCSFAEPPAEAATACSAQVALNSTRWLQAHAMSLLAAALGCSRCTAAACCHRAIHVVSCVQCACAAAVLQALAVRWCTQC